MKDELYYPAVNIFRESVERKFNILIGIRGCGASYRHLNEFMSFKHRIMFNYRCTILEIGIYKVVVKCHPNDNFSSIIGFGLALSRIFEKIPRFRMEIRALKEILDYRELADYCILKYYQYNPKIRDKELYRIVESYLKLPNSTWINI